MPDQTETQNRTPALLAVQAVAMAARQGRVVDHDVEHMGAMVANVLDSDDPLAAEAGAFAALVRDKALRRDPYALEKAGERLDRALEIALGVGAPVVPYRADLDG